MERICSGLRLLILTSALALPAAATPMFFGVNANTPGGSSGSSMTLDANWGEVDCNSATTCTVTSATRTISGSGTMKMVFTNSYTVQYSKNGGAFTSFSTGATLAVSNADTIAFKVLSMAPCDGSVITVTDNSTGGAIGDFTGLNNHGC